MTMFADSLISPTGGRTPNNGAVATLSFSENNAKVAIVEADTGMPLPRDSVPVMDVLLYLSVCLSVYLSVFFVLGESVCGPLFACQ